ncbi:MAG: porin family protein [Solirubrobacteraceae bacterium]
MKKIKHIIFLTLLILLSNSLKSQFFSNKTTEFNLEERDNRNWNLGFYLGYNLLQYSIETNPNISLSNKPTVSYKSNGGLNIGLMLKRRLIDNLDLRFEPGAIFVDRSITFEELDPLINSTNTRSKPSTYIYLPLVIDFHGNRHYNVRSFISTGIAYLYNIQSKENNVEDNQQNIFRTTSNNFAAQAEIGLNIYFNKFKLTPSIKGLFFLNNELVKDNTGTLMQAETIKDIRTNGLMLSFKFE